MTRILFYETDLGKALVLGRTVGDVNALENELFGMMLLRSASCALLPFPVGSEWRWNEYQIAEF